MTPSKTSTDSSTNYSGVKWGTFRVPNDPAFFFHHCLVDNFIQRFKDYALKHHFELNYPNISEANLLKGFNSSLLNFSDTQGANHVMHPFDDLINEYGLFADINKEFSYRYDVSPCDIDCDQDSDCCDSKYFWCDDRASHKCILKVMAGGDCEATFPAKACYCKKGLPWINNGRCECSIKYTKK